VTRRLLIVPIVHTSAELGSEGQQNRAEFVARHGDLRWAEREAKIEHYWLNVRDAVLALPIGFDQVKVYQDSLPDGPGTDRLVEDMAEHGNSPNHRVLKLLKARGASIIGTESLSLLLEEYQAIKDGRASPDLLRRSLEARDRYIADRIGSTLAEGEIGILFIGAAHDVARFCDPSIKVAVLASGARNNRENP
jgi:hypothetical protein